MPITTYGDISPRVGIIAEVKMLEHAEPILVLQKFGDAKPQPKNKGQTVKFRRPVPFAKATTALTEGVTPASQKIAYQDVSVTMAQYGAWTEITDVIADTHEDPVLQDVTMLLGEQAAETFEALTWGVISGGTSVIYANGTARNGVNTAISLNKLRLASRSLKKQRAKKITKIIRDEGPKGVKAQIQGDEIRVSSKKRDDLQAVIALLKGADLDVALQFVNYR